MKASQLSMIIVILATFTNENLFAYGYAIPSGPEGTHTLHPDENGGEVVDLDALPDENYEYQRIKRSPQRSYSSELVFSPDLGYGYYVFPRSLNQQSNFEYNPIVKYKSTRTKRKKLFVPNLFG